MRIKNILNQADKKQKAEEEEEEEMTDSGEDELVSVSGGANWGNGDIAEVKTVRSQERRIEEFEKEEGRVGFRIAKGLILKVWIVKRVW